MKRRIGQAPATAACITTYLPPVGPGQALAELVPSVTLALLRGERPKVSSGTVGADCVYITDVVEGFHCRSDRARN